MTNSPDIKSKPDFSSNALLFLISNALPLAIYIPTFGAWGYDIVFGNADATAGEVFLLLASIPFYFIIRLLITLMIGWLAIAWNYTCRDENPIRMILKTCVLIAWVFGPLIWFIAQMD
jgi:hypothetical protein